MVDNEPLEEFQATTDHYQSTCFVAAEEEKEPNLVKRAFTASAIQAFTFGKLTTERSAVAADQGWASIKVEILSVAKTGTVPRQVVSANVSSVNKKEAKKGKLMCDRITSLGQVVKEVGADEKYSSTIRRLDDKFYCVFTFHYRGRDLLEAEDIIPVQQSQESPIPSQSIKSPANEIITFAQSLPSQKRDQIRALLDDSNDVVLTGSQKLKKQPWFP
ncbi:hypothetical protein HDV00_012617 [Rhizophlyctis rosea]|nr:hypothetical protein HDV00_012617 [Rhizophlyctis rosea]